MLSYIGCQLLKLISPLISLTVSLSLSSGIVAITENKMIVANSLFPSTLHPVFTIDFDY